MQVVMKLDRETKNTVRYQAEEDDFEAVVDTVYVQKRALAAARKDGKWPERIRVTVEVPG